MQSVRDHYSKLLGPVYAWSTGGVEAALTRGDGEIQALALSPRKSALAVDLGAGFGMHAIPLARRGFSVLAVDTSPELLRQLSAQAAGLSVKTVETDILSFRGQLEGDAEVILCMGDTLTHLPTLESVETLFDEAAAALTSGGVFVMTFRDYSAALLAERRFIPVRSDADRILTCFLEYDDSHVTVHDLLHEREETQWKMNVSSYRKLRLAREWVTRALEGRGFRVTQEAGLGGMVRFVSHRA